MSINDLPWDHSWILLNRARQVQLLPNFSTAHNMAETDYLLINHCCNIVVSSERLQELNSINHDGATVTLRGAFAAHDKRVATATLYKGSGGHYECKLELNWRRKNGMCIESATRWRRTLGRPLYKTAHHH